MTHRRVLAILAVVLIVRLGMVSLALNNPTAPILPDSVEYLKLSDQLAEGNLLVENQQDLIWPPGYPVFMFIMESLLGGGITALALSQLALSSVTAALIFHILDQLGHRLAAFAAALLYAISPAVAFWSLTVMSETLFAFVLVASLLLLLRSLENRSIALICLSGAFLGASALIRPIGIPLIPVWIGVLILTGRDQFPLAARLRFSSLLLVGLIPVMAWSMRNWIVRGDFAFSRVGSKTFISFNLGWALAELEGIDRSAAATIIAESGDPQAFARQFVLEHPAHFVLSQAKGVARTALGAELHVWSNFYGTGREEGFGMLSAALRGDFVETAERIKALASDIGSRATLRLLALSFLHSVVLFGFGVIAVLKRKARESASQALFLLTLLTAALLILSPAGAGQGRFRVPSEPFLAILAGIGFSTVFSQRKMNDSIPQS